MDATPVERDEIAVMFIRQARLSGEPPELYGRIGPTFEALIARTAPDESRPSIEFYRRFDEIDLLLPLPGK